jgi:molybdenum cofactor biosynthesis enzyme MoaA
MCPAGHSIIKREPFGRQEVFKATFDFLTYCKGNRFENYPNVEIDFLLYPHLLGEPLLYDGLEDWIKQAVKIPNTKTCVCTNGLLLDDRRIDSLLNAGLRYIWFTFFGTTKKEYTNITRQPEHFDVAKTNLSRLLLRHNDFELVHAVTWSKSWNEFDRLIRASNIQTQEGRYLLEWKKLSEYPNASEHRTLCINTEGDITFWWGDYNSKEKIGNILTMPQDELASRLLGNRIKLESTKMPRKRLGTRGSI